MTGGLMRIEGGGGGIGSLSDLEPESKQRLWNVTIATTQVPNGNFVAKRIRVESDETVKVWGASVQTKERNTPTDLKGVVVDETNSTTTEVLNGSFVEKGSPLVEFDGPITVSFRQANDTGSTEDVNSAFSVTVEPQ